MHGKRIRMSREERKNHILTAIEEHTDGTRWRRGHSVSSIARYCKLSVSPYLRGLIDELVDDGMLRMEGYTHTGGVCGLRYVYCLPERYREMSANQKWLGRVF